MIFGIDFLVGFGLVAAILGLKHLISPPTKSSTRVLGNTAMSPGDYYLGLAREVMGPIEDVVKAAEEEGERQWRYEREGIKPAPKVNRGSVGATGYRGPVGYGGATGAMGAPAAARWGGGIIGPRPYYEDGRSGTATQWVPQTVYPVEGTQQYLDKMKAAQHQVAEMMVAHTNQIAASYGIPFHQLGEKMGALSTIERGISLTPEQMTTLGWNSPVFHYPADARPLDIKKLNDVLMSVGVKPDAIERELASTNTTR